MVMFCKNKFKKIKQVREVGDGYLLGGGRSGMEKQKSRSTQKPKDRKISTHEPKTGRIQSVPEIRQGHQIDQKSQKNALRNQECQKARIVRNSVSKRVIRR